MIKKNMGSKETFATNCAAQNTMLNEVYMEKLQGEFIHKIKYFIYFW